MKTVVLVFVADFPFWSVLRHIWGRPHPNAVLLPNDTNGVPLPSILKFSEARNIRRFEFDEYAATLPEQERQAFVVAVAAMEILLLRTLAPQRVAGLVGLLESVECYGSVAADFAGNPSSELVGTASGNT